MGRWIRLFALFLIAVPLSLADLPSCTRAKCSHCETELIARLCPTTCGNCPSPTTSKIVAHGQTNVQRAPQTELQALPQPTQQQQQPPPQPQLQQPQQQPQYQQPLQYNPYYQPQQQYQYGFRGYQQPTYPQQSFQPFQVQTPAPLPPTQSPFFNPFQPFLQQSYQAQTPFNPFTFPTFAPVTFAPVTQPPPVTAAPPVYRPQPIQLPTYGQVDGGKTQIQTPGPSQNVYQPRPVPPPPNVQQPAPAQKPKQIYNGQQPQPTQPQTPYYPQAPQQVIKPPQSVYPTPVVVPSAPAPAPTVTSPSQSQTCPRAGWEPCISKEVANERFRNCCLRLGEGCAQICSYDQNLAAVQVAVLTGRCPISKVADMMVCASGYEDATPCCQAYGVFEPGFEHCRPYCNPSAGLPNDGMLAEKFRCLGKMSQIQRCFYVTQRP